MCSNDAYHQAGADKTAEVQTGRISLTEEDDDELEIETERPEPVPLLPNYDVLIRQDGARARRARTVNCNFFQMIENSVDQNHLKWLHRTAQTPDWDDGEIDPRPFELGIINTYTRRVAGKTWAHCNFFVMPTMNKTGNVEEGHPTEHRASSAGEVMRWRVPIDDTHTLLMRVRFKPSDNPGKYEGDPFSRRWKPPQEFIVPYKEYRDSDNPELGYEIPPLHFIEDGMVVDSMPPIADRENENLGPAIDDGIIKLRQMYLREIEKVKHGEDPKCIVRDPEKNKLIVIPAYEKWVPESERNQGESAAAG